MILTWIGLLVTTGMCLYLTFSFIALLMLSDESLWNTIKWNWQFVLGWMLVIVVSWGVWWWLVKGISIAVSVTGV